jgi:ribosome-binding protein aMBF1 (putative translation factor)
MKCTICGKEHTGGVTITLLDATWYYCSSICAFKSGHSDPVKEAMINFFATKHEGAKNTEQVNQPDKEDLHE